MVKSGKVEEMWLEGGRAIVNRALYMGLYNEIHPALGDDEFSPSWEVT
jgi:hypothetical protein